MALAAVAVLLSAVGVPASNGGLDHRAAVESAPDPTCSTGIKADGVCCPRSCGSCGGHGCGSLPGGAAACCAGGIIASGRVCSSDPPPCAMSGGGGGWPPPEPTNKTVGVSVSVGQAVIATVSDRFVSYNLDSGWVSVQTTRHCQPALPHSASKHRESRSTSSQSLFLFTWPTNWMLMAEYSPALLCGNAAYGAVRWCKPRAADC